MDSFQGDDMAMDDMGENMEVMYDEDGNPIPVEDDKPKEPQNPLKLEELRKGLKKISKTYNGLSYAYIQLDLKDKELDEIGEDLNNYVHLRDVNLSTNKFSHINPVQNMTYLVQLDASKNEIRDMEVFTLVEKLQFLQILNLKENKIKELPNMTTKSLTNLNLEANLIDNCSNFQGLPKLQKLNLNQNKLKSCEGLGNMPMLNVLYLNENQIASLKGLENLDNLRKLRLKTNKIETLTNEYVPNLPNLEKLDINENQIADVKHFSALKFPKLKRINVDANPYFDGPNAGGKIEILIQLEDFDIKFVNKEEVVPEDKEEAMRLKEERIQKEKEEAEERERQRLIEEEERKQKEEEERLEREREEKERKEKEEEERLAEEERLKQERLAQEEADAGDNMMEGDGDGEGNMMDGEADGEGDNPDDE